MRRLVYSPKVQAWINSTEGVVDVSPYIVSGQINRKINQVSTASLVLRNPVQQNGQYVGTLFTEYPRADGTTGPLFHPMDPIIVTMQRLEGHPVQVFTGYLDKSPYLQLYPGLCQVEASCTLKRLLYTQWDAALPFVQYFLTQFGWVPDGNSGIINPTSEESQLKTFAGKIQNQFNDGSLGSLIYAILLYVAQWDHNTIFIEELPANIKDYVITLFTRIQADVGADETIFQNLIQQILGIGSQGGGGPSASGTASGPVHGAKQITQTVAQIASQFGISPKLPLAVMDIETGFHNQDSPGNPHYGWFQCQTASPPYAFGPWSKTAPTVSQCHDLGLACTAFCAAAAGWAKSNPSLKSNLQQWAMKVQGVNGQNNPLYITGWPNAIATAESYLRQFGGGTTTTSGTIAAGANPLVPQGVGQLGLAPSAGATQSSPNSAQVSGTSPGGKKGRQGAQAQTTRYQVMIEAANTINKQSFPYIWGGGHGAPGVPTGGGFDCSGVVSAIFFAAGLTTASFDTNTEVATLGSNVVSGLDHSAGAVNIFVTPAHTFMQIGGRYFGTWANGTSTAGGGGWLSDGSPTGYAAYHVPHNILQQTTANALPAAAGGPGGNPTLPGGGSGSGSGTNATATAFSTMINLPSIFQTAEAIAFTGKRSFIADSPLFPFIEQLCQASLRNFMSMPNGNFFAFFPDYFGLFGRNYYWEVRDLEIMDGHIDLSDDPLATHVAVAGDVTQFHGTVDVFDLLLTAGIFDIFDAFALGYISGEDSLVGANLTITKPNDPQGKARGKNEALDFLKRYGARTYVEEVPAIRSPFFELFYSFMKFMLMWSKQFMTTFELTFMPELFPGGLVALPDHNLQLYVEEVVHSFDYTSGFTTTANFSSPSRLNDKSRPNLREGLTHPSNATQFVSVPDPINLNTKKAKK